MDRHCLDHNRNLIRAQPSEKPGTWRAEPEGMADAARPARRGRLPAVVAAILTGTWLLGLLAASGSVAAAAFTTGKSLLSSFFGLRGCLVKLCVGRGLLGLRGQRFVSFELK